MVTDGGRRLADACPIMDRPSKDVQRDRSERLAIDVLGNEPVEKT
jgi:hypothetical protein